METCFTCHERNPHDGHWGELECSDCHKMHRASLVLCNNCHDPLMEDGPGWQ